MEQLVKICKSIGDNQRYGWVFLVLLLVFVINKKFPADIITSESCANNGCKAVLHSSNLNDASPVVYFNDIFKSSPGEYYRLTFQAKATQNADITIIISDPLDNKKELKKINFKKTTKDFFHEILFRTDKRYTDVIFEKENANDHADISIGGLQVSKLNVDNEKEFLNFKPTLRGEIDFDIPDQFQSENSVYFEQLKEPDVIFGQIFKSQIDYVTGVSLDIDIIKQGNSGGKKYQLELRKVEYEEGGAPEIKSDVISGISFEINDLEEYRQEDGKFKFPLFAKLEKDKYYFIGIDNERVEVNKFNFLRLKGSSEEKKYLNGFPAVKMKGQTYSVIGDLYFTTYGMNFSKYDNKKLLRGTIIEDIGKNKGLFKYQPRRDIYDLTDLEEYTEDIKLDDSMGVLFGSINPNKKSELVYKFETIYPFLKFKVFAKQADLKWGKVSLSYSYDREKWNEIPSAEVGEILPSMYGIQEMQTFDQEITENNLKNEVYIKIAPRNYDAQEKKYGLSDFRFEADLVMK